MTLDAIKILMDEHKLILRGLRVAEVMAKRFYENMHVKADDLNRLMDFIKNYADTFHHKKEEDILFLWMRERGFPVEQGPISIMLREHDVGRNYITTIQDAMQDYDAEKKTVVEMVVGTLIDFSSHLSNHIFKEDNILYPMAVKLADTSSDQELIRRYRDKISPEEAQKANAFHGSLIIDLEKQYHQL